LSKETAPGEPIRYEKTRAGLQGVIVTVKPTQAKLGAIKSGIPLREQIKGTMFEPGVPDEPTLFDEEP
jgi:hypothetical protein